MPAYANPFNPTTQVGRAFSRSAELLRARPTENEIALARHKGFADIARADKAIAEADLTRGRLDALSDTAIFETARRMTGQTSGPEFDQAVGTLRLGRINPDRTKYGSELQDWQVAGVNAEIASGARDPGAGGDVVKAMTGKSQYGSGQFGTYNESTGRLSDPALFKSREQLYGAQVGAENALAGQRGASADLDRARTDRVVSGTDTPMEQVYDPGVPGSDFSPPRIMHVPRTQAAGRTAPPSARVGNQQLVKTWVGRNPDGSDRFEWLPKTPGASTTEKPPAPPTPRPAAPETRIKLSRTDYQEIDTAATTAAGGTLDPETMTRIQARAEELASDPASPTFKRIQASVQQAIKEIAPQGFEDRNSFWQRGHRFAPKGGAAPAQVPGGQAVPPPAQRQKGQRYLTPRGWMTWTGTGWLPDA